MQTPGVGAERRQSADSFMGKFSPPRRDYAVRAYPPPVSCRQLLSKPMRALIHAQPQPQPPPERPQHKQLSQLAPSRLLGPGLENLGNTCYLNASLQARSTSCGATTCASLLLAARKHCS